MISEKDIYMKQEQYKDMMRDAAQERLARQALGQPTHQRQPVLAWLGQNFERLASATAALQRGIRENNMVRGAGGTHRLRLHRSPRHFVEQTSIQNRPCE